MLFEGFGGVADGVEHASVGVGELDVAACHHACGDFEELCHRYVGEAGGGAFAEGGDEVAGEA